MKDLREVFHVKGLVVVEHAAHLFALHVDLVGLLLLLPVITQHVLHFLLVAFQPAFQLVDPNNTIGDIREITSRTQAMVMLLLL